MNKLDDQVLLQYLDGDMDNQMISDLADQLARDSGGRDRLVELVGVQASLRAMAKGVMEEEIPPTLLAAVRKGGSRPLAGKFFLFPPLRYAAVVCLMVVGFLFGRTAGEERLPLDSALFPVIPAALEQVVNATLEFEPSGATQVWQDGQQKYHARVIPVRTFRDEKGEFYRMYYLELVRGENSRSYVGIALRTGNKTWQTRSVSLRDVPMNI